jgi:hypothetical protein
MRPLDAPNPAAQALPGPTADINLRNSFAGKKNAALRFAELVCADSQLTLINDDRIAELAVLWSNDPFPIPRWDWRIYLQTSDFNERARYDFILQSINYCYWHPEVSPDGSERRFHDNGKEHGADLAALRLTQAWDTISQPEFLAKVTEEYVGRSLFAAKEPIPLIAERTECLKEAGAFLDKLRSDGRSFTDVFNSLGNDAYEVAQYLQMQLPLWQDPFMKRAQLFVGMLFGRFQDDPGCPISRESLVHLTEFADYRIPETLYVLGAISYSKKLTEKIRNRELLTLNGEEETEIRAASLVALDRLRLCINKLRSDQLPITALETDYVCWSALRGKDEQSLARLIVQEKLPHPRCVNIRY